MHSVSYMNEAGSLLEKSTLFTGLFCTEDMSNEGSVQVVDTPDYA